MRTLAPLAVAVPLLLAVPAPPAAPQEAPEESGEVLGAPAAFGEAVRDERVQVTAGSVLRELPDPRAPALATVDAPTYLPILERRGGWAKVRYGALVGWLVLDGSEAAFESSGALPGRSADPELLARALSHLEGSGSPEASRLGPFVFYSDLDDPALAGFLGRVMDDTLRAYRELYGLDPGLGEDEVTDPEAPRETVVLFHREEDYRAFTASQLDLAGLEEEGFAGFGLAALHAGSRSREELASLLVHEVVHLLNRRSLGPLTPPWLEEGLADGLAFARIGPEGRLDPDELGGVAREHRREIRDGRGGGWQVTVTTGGGWAALDRLEAALDDRALPTLATLTSLGWRELVDPAARELYYAESAFFVRWLLEDQVRADGFRAYLRSVAAGGAGESSDLLRALGGEGGDWKPLERRFHRWLRARSLRVGG